MLAEKPTYGYDYYNNLLEGTRVELIDGKIYNMSPSPSRRHQGILMEIAHKIRGYLEGKSCEIYPAPFDVFLVNDEQEIENCTTIVQPDISVICDRNKLIDQGCKGAPDFIIEIVSPSSKKHDYFNKATLYNEYGTREYWVINPMKETIHVYLAGDDGFEPPIQYTFNDAIKVGIFDSLEINFSELKSF